MSEWNLSQLRKIAGISESTQTKKEVLNERWSDDDDGYDDEDPDVKIAGSDKRQAAFEKRNKKEIKSANKDADKKDADKKVASQNAKTAEKDVKKEEPVKKAPEAEEKKTPAKEEKPDAGTAEPKRRGKAPNEASFNQQAKKYAKEHSRSSFIKWAAETHGKGKNYASAMFAKYNPKSGREQKVVEASVLWGIAHPSLKGFTLADNHELNQLQWIDSSSALDSMIFTTEAEAQKVAKYMAEWKNQSVTVEQYDFADDTE